MRKIGVLMLLLSFSAIGSCGSGGGGGVVNPPPAPPPPPPPPACPANSVCMRAGTFSPQDLTVPAGTAVAFTNDSGITHNVVFDPPVAIGVGDIGLIDSGSQTRTFGNAGTWPFHCTIHGGVGSGMHGTIIVP